MTCLNPRINKQLTELKQRYPIVDHPLIENIIHGQFSVEQMHLVAERFYHVVKNFPRFLAAMISHWDNTEARMPLVENLFEEHGRMNKRDIHLNTFTEFLSDMGLDVHRIKSSSPTPATLSYVDLVLSICSKGHPNRGLGALGYIEDIVHQVSAIIGGAVKQQQKNLVEVSHFSDHEILDDQHSKEIYAMLILDKEADYDEALHGLTMGAYYHFQLYETILREVMHDSKTTIVDIKTTHLNYPLKTGEEGKLRLDILNRLYNQTSIDFFAKHIQTHHQHILDYGCGSGQLARELAILLPHKKIVGVDNALAQINLALAQRPNHNLEFLTSDIAHLETKEKFDVIYMRWVLIYQKNLHEMFDLFSTVLNDDGLLIIEDNEPGQSGCFSATHQTHVDHWQNFWTQAMSIVGQGPGFCARLCELSRQQNLSLLDLAINQQLLRTHEEKQLFYLGIVESEKAILGSGVGQNIYDAIKQNAFAISKSELPVGFVRNFQLCFVKSSGTKRQNKI